MFPLRDCTPAGYKEQFDNEVDKALEKLPLQNPWINDGEFVFVSLSTIVPAIKTLQTMQKQCKSSGPKDCTPVGYFHAVAEDKAVREKVTNLVMKEFIGNGLAALGGCVVGGVIGGVVGAIRTPAYFYVGGSFGFVEGCKMGMKAGPVLYNGYKVHSSFSENIDAALESSNSKQTDYVSPPPKALGKASGIQKKVGGIKGVADEIGKVITKHGQGCPSKQQFILPSAQHTGIRSDKEWLFSHQTQRDNLSKDNGGINPFKNWVLTTIESPSTTLYRSGKKVVNTLCNTRPTLKNFCKVAQDHMPKCEESKRGHALILTANSDHNGALRFDYGHGTRSVPRETQWPRFQRVEHSPLVSHLLSTDEEPVASLSEFRDRARAQWVKEQMSPQQVESIPEETDQENNLPAAPKILLTPSLLHPKRSTIGISTHLVSGTNVGVTASPTNIKNTSVNISTESSSGQSIGLQIVARKPKASILTAQYATDGQGYGIGVPLSKPAKAGINVHFEYGDYKFGAKVFPKKPLNSEVSAECVVPIYGIPFAVGGKMQLKHPENIKLTLGIPTFGINKLLGKCGISMPSSFRILSVSRHTPSKTWNKIRKVMGFKKRKKKIEEEKIYIFPCFIDPVLIQKVQNSVYQLQISQMQLLHSFQSGMFEHSLEEICASQERDNLQLARGITLIEERMQPDLNESLTLSIAKLEEANEKSEQSIFSLNIPLVQYQEVDLESKAVHEEFIEVASDLKQAIKNTVQFEKRQNIKYDQGVINLSDCLQKLKAAMPHLKKKIQLQKHF